MGVILVEGYDEPNGRIIQFPSECCQLPPVSDAEIGRMRGLEDRRLARKAVDTFHGTEPTLPANGLDSSLRPDSCTFTEPPTPVVMVSTDVQGSPRESRCAKSQLDNILAVRDEEQARRARGTVRPIDQPDCPNCHLPEDQCFCADENDFHGDE